MVKQIDRRRAGDDWDNDWTYEQRVAVLADIGRPIEERLTSIDNRLTQIDQHLKGHGPLTDMQFNIRIWLCIIAIFGTFGLMLFLAGWGNAVMEKLFR